LLQLLSLFNHFQPQKLRAKWKMAAQTDFSSRKVDFARADRKTVRAKGWLACANRTLAAQTEFRPRESGTRPAQSEFSSRKTGLVITSAGSPVFHPCSICGRKNLFSGVYPALIIARS
jgi:hypothetical protein